MDQQPKQRKRRNRHRSKGQKKPQEPDFVPVKLEFEPRMCHLCHQMITDMTSALAQGAQGDPVHLECALTYLHETETILEGESLIYMGAGHFAIVKKGPPLEIVRKIAYENKDVFPDWKKEMKRLALSLVPAFTEDLET